MARNTVRGTHGLQRFLSRDLAHRDGGSQSRHGVGCFQTATRKYKIVRTANKPEKLARRQNAGRRLTVTVP